MSDRESRPTWSQLITPTIFRNILDGLHEGVALLEPEVEPPGPHFIYANAAFGTITGYREIEVIGLPFERLTGAREDHPSVSALLDELRRGRPGEGECFAHAKSGAELVLGVSLRPILQGDGQCYTVCVLRDRTAERRMEAIAHAATLAESTASIFAGLRHEIGNPINSIKAALSLVRDRLETFPLEKTADYLDRALGEIERIEFLLKAMRSFSSRERPNLQALDPIPLVERLLVLSRPELERRAIIVSPAMPRDVGLVRVDPRALYQVLLNLLLNAADAVDGAAEPEIRIELSRMGKRVLVRVVDNGSGILPEHLRRVFDPFFTTKTSGTGLGLGICQRLCAAMNATVTLESEAGQGTVATVDLDADVADPRAR